MFTLFHFCFLVQKALPQLHFVLIMKSGFVSIMTNGGSCHYQQTVFGTTPKHRETPQHSRCAPIRDSHYLFPPYFHFAVVVNCQQCSMKIPVHPSVWLVSSQIKHCSMMCDSQNFSPPTLETSILSSCKKRAMRFFSKASTFRSCWSYSPFNW